jgi:hypothetical protein
MNKMKINKYCLWLNIVGCIGVAIILLYDQTIGLRFRIYGALMVSFTVMFGCLLLSKKTKIIKIDRITTEDDWEKWIGLNIIKQPTPRFEKYKKMPEWNFRNKEFLFHVSPCKAAVEQCK